MGIMSEFPCTCWEPPAVKLLDNNTADDIISTDTNAEQLLNNLRNFGWSPILVNVPSCSPPTQARIAQLFQKQDPHDNSSVEQKWIYCAAESGGSETIEPKESLEVSHATAVSFNHIVHDWYKTLSFIGHKVATLLQIPPNTLLASEETEDCIDLMRVFYYHKISIPAEEQKRVVFGSSPHTDWGSWTVVWQDDVGGLETYCRACSKWIPVTPARQNIHNNNSRKNLWQCIVHVSDMTSLALGCSSDDTGSAADGADSMTMTFPSPRHRVVSSAESIRTSLVYFAYPPSTISMKDIQTKLQNWKRSDRGMRLPLSEYYLLRDQSSSTEGGSAPPEATLRKIEPLSVRQAIETKWSQVQRTGAY